MSLMRDALLAAADNAWLRERAMRQRFVRRAVSRFMPGEGLDDALAAASKLHERRVGTILTHLGENVSSREEIAEVQRHYLEALERIAAAGIDAEVSIKLTQLGLDQGVELARDHTAQLAIRARARGARLWIDMEGSAYTERTLAVYQDLRPAHPNLGVALQAYLRRSRADLDALLALGSAVRLVKGAYREPESIAFPQKAEVDENFFELARRMLAPEARARGNWVTLGTHDPRLIARIEQLVAAGHAPRDGFEFAMLFGIRRGEPERLIAAGYRARVLISYGSHWFPWYMRRLAERPANLWFVMRSMLG